MDYIIFGLGAGASLVLAGWLFRELGPKLRDRNSSNEEVLGGGELVVRMAWARFCGTCGMALLLCGLLILIVTGALIAASPDDSIGGLIVVGVFFLTLVLMLVWVGLYLRQFGTLGIVRNRDVLAPAAAASTTHPDEEPTTPQAPHAPDIGAPEHNVPFEQAATARGGFGRFASFLRAESDQPRHEFAASDEKRLRVDDPLVTEIYAELGRSTPMPVIEELASHPESRVTDDPATEAIEVLRQRRLARHAVSLDDATTSNVPYTLDSE